MIYFLCISPRFSAFRGVSPHERFLHGKRDAKLLFFTPVASRKTDFVGSFRFPAVFFFHILSGILIFPIQFDLFRHGNVPWRRDFAEIRSKIASFTPGRDARCFKNHHLASFSRCGNNCRPPGKSKVPAFSQVEIKKFTFLPDNDIMKQTGASGTARRTGKWK